MVSTVSGGGDERRADPDRTLLFCLRFLRASSLLCLMRIDCLLGGSSPCFCRAERSWAGSGFDCVRSGSDSDVVDRSESLEYECFKFISSEGRLAGSSTLNCSSWGALARPTAVAVDWTAPLPIVFRLIRMTGTNAEYLPFSSWNDRTT